MLYTNREFRCQVIRYLDQFWSSETELLKIEERFGYTNRYFKCKFRESFGISYAQYLKKFKLHRAAMEMSKQNIFAEPGRLAGFSNAQSFSKAFREEFEVSPRKFLKNRWDVPDLPVCHTIKGRSIEIEYEAIRPENAEGRWQVWEGEKIFIGNIIASRDELHGDMIQLCIPAGYYAVISVDRCMQREEAVEDSAEDLSSLIKEVLHFVLKEWMVANKKVRKKERIIYVICSEKKLSVLMPLYRSSINSFLGKKETGPVYWINYIEDHLTEGLTEEEFASHFHYSKKHFRDTFHMYYGIAPDEYIKRRRLYKVVRALKVGYPELAGLVKRFKFQSVADFRREFFETFRQTPEKYRGEYKVEDLITYYDRNREKISVRFVAEKGFYIAGKNVEEGKSGIYVAQGLIGCIVTALRCDASDYPIQVVVWQTRAETGEHICLTGPLTGNETNAMKSFTGVFIEGGDYAVMETLQESDEENLEDVYRLLYRCAFRGWLVENREHIDLERLTFVVYQNGKLQFHIPVFA